MEDKLWSNSADSHLLEPKGLFQDNLPADLAERMPKRVKDADGRWETIHVDGQAFRRRLPEPGTAARTMPRPADAGSYEERAPGANDPVLRLRDSDDEGVWAEVIYPSLGIWAFNIRDPKLVREGVRVLNDWALDFQRHSPRYVVCASIPLLDVGDAVAEVHRAAGLGFHAGFFPTREPFGRPPYHHEEWDPLWAAMEEEGMVVGFHIGTEPHTPDQRTGRYHRGGAGRCSTTWRPPTGGSAVSPR